MAKLTLSIDESVINQAKRYAHRRGTSVSRIVEEYLSLVTETRRETVQTPVLRSIRGILKQGDVASYRNHLIEKYR